MIESSCCLLQFDSHQGENGKQQGREFVLRPDLIGRSPLPFSTTTCSPGCRMGAIATSEVLIVW
eukprot:756861-Hanusia_phi.AAC.2